MKSGKFLSYIEFSDDNACGFFKKCKMFGNCLKGQVLNKTIKKRITNDEFYKTANSDFQTFEFFTLNFLKLFFKEKVFIFFFRNKMTGIHVKELELNYTYIKFHKDTFIFGVFITLHSTI